MRFGVAPDHPEVKSVTQDFEKVASDDRFRYFGSRPRVSDARTIERARTFRVCGGPRFAVVSKTEPSFPFIVRDWNLGNVLVGAAADDLQAAEL